MQFCRRRNTHETRSPSVSRGEPRGLDLAVSAVLIEQSYYPAQGSCTIALECSKCFTSRLARLAHQPRRTDRESEWRWRCLARAILKPPTCRDGRCVARCAALAGISIGSFRRVKPSLTLAPSAVAAQLVKLALRLRLRFSAAIACERRAELIALLDRVIQPAPYEALPSQGADREVTAASSVGS